MSIYNIEVNTIEGQPVVLNEYQGKVLLIVNTASKCGFTPQYKELQELYEQYREQGFAVLGFPCNQFMNQEPGDEMEIQSFCKLNYQVSFPMFSKVDVKGPSIHPLYSFLTETAPGVLGSKGVKWNFTKFLVNRQGEVVNRFSPQKKPSELKKIIEDIL